MEGFYKSQKFIKNVLTLRGNPTSLDKNLKLNFDNLVEEYPLGPIDISAQAASLENEYQKAFRPSLQKESTAIELVGKENQNENGVIAEGQLKEVTEDGNSLAMKPFVKFIKVDEQDFKESMGERLGKTKRRGLTRTVESPRIFIILMINIGAWNIRGLNNILKQKEVSLFIWKNKIDLIAILETKV